MNNRLRIAVVDDHPLLRESIVRLLRREDDIHVLAEGGSAEEALAIAQEHLPDVMLLDVSMPGNGISAARAITSACPVVKTIMLTVFEDESTVAAALDAGARGYVLKGVSGPELLRAVRTINSGAAYVSPALASRLLAESGRNKSRIADDPDPLSKLSPREEEILALVAQHRTNGEIAEGLQIPEQTVRQFMTNIVQKLHVRARVRAAVLARTEQASFEGCDARD